jgi:hypothetical protein
MRLAGYIIAALTESLRIALIALHGWAPIDLATPVFAKALRATVTEQLVAQVATAEVFLRVVIFANGALPALARKHLVTLITRKRPTIWLLAKHADRIFRIASITPALAAGDTLDWLWRARIADEFVANDAATYGFTRRTRRTAATFAPRAIFTFSTARESLDTEVATNPGQLDDGKTALGCPLDEPS